MLLLASSSFSIALSAAPSVAATAAGVVTAIFAVSLLVLALAALLYTEPQVVRPTTRLLVVVPAHNESELIARCVASLVSQTYPTDLYKIVVVADNCTDDTATAARRAGAHIVLERHEPTERGKGHALRWATTRLLRSEPSAEAFVVVDADSVAREDFLAKLVQPLKTGARAAQGESLLYSDGAHRSELRVVAFLLVNRVRPAGRTVLGLPISHLAGNGMLLTRELLLERPWTATSSAEDLEYSLDLRASGIGIAYAGGAVLMSPTAPNAHAAAAQQMRWEGGKIHLARTRLPGLLRRAISARSPALLGAAFDLASPALGMLTVVALAGVGAVASAASLTGAVDWWVLVPWIAALSAIPMYVLVGLRAAQAPRSCYAALLGAPLLLVGKLRHMRALVQFRGDTWVRTERSPARREHS